jgi:hypothetical protein
MKEKIESLRIVIPNSEINIYTCSVFNKGLDEIRCHVAGSTEGQQPKIHALLNYELLHLQTYLFEARRN